MRAAKNTTDGPTASTPEAGEKLTNDSPEFQFQLVAGNKRPLRIPAILLEGDPVPVAVSDLSEPSSPVTAEQSVSSQPVVPEIARPETTQQFASEDMTVRQTGRSPQAVSAPPHYSLRLIPRDPHWLYADWDIPGEAIVQKAASSPDGQAFLRVFAGSCEGPLVAQSVITPHVQHQFVAVGRADTTYIAEVGCRGSQGEWIVLSRSAPTATPPETTPVTTERRDAPRPGTAPPPTPSISPSPIRAAESLPLPAVLQRAAEVTLAPVPDHPILHGELPVLALTGSSAPGAETAISTPQPVVPSQPSMGRLAAGDFIPVSPTAAVATEGQALAMANPLISVLSGISSQMLVKPAPAELALAGAISSPGAAWTAAQPKRGFWFTVNAELVVYGATEPNAQVEIDGRPIALRPDGTFSVRIALPDGTFPLPISAKSADGQEVRVAKLEFTRSTQHEQKLTPVRE